jgi:hypothetical protein
MKTKNKKPLDVEFNDGVCMSDELRETILNFVNMSNSENIPVHFDIGEPFNLFCQIKEVQLKQHPDDPKDEFIQIILESDELDEIQELAKALKAVGITIQDILPRSPIPREKMH